ncbi:MAG: hypothetical protein JSV42_01025 [Chloroflexota bacterium]|nr:MAG: hypothetical protein JSV42_01025 [Chloroflexota bacterium]
MSTNSTIKKGFKRLLITLVISLALVWIGSEVAFFFLKEDTDRLPEQIELVIPPGTAEKVATGEEVPTIPDEMTFVLGDTLVVKNEDTVDHQLGPLWIPPRSKASLVLDAAERYAYSCSFQASRYLGLNVRKPTTWQTRFLALGFTVPATTAFFFIYSLALWPLTPSPEKKKTVLNKVGENPS